MLLPLVALITLSGFKQQSTTWIDFQVQKYIEWKTLDDLTEAVRKDYRLPGLCMAYLQGANTETSVTGLRNMQNTTMPIEDDDRLLVGSIGKSMTAMLIARLIEMQKFDWRTTLAEALPNIKMLDVYKKITIDQLLRHKGRLPQMSLFSPAELDKILAKPESATKIREAFVTALLTREPDPTKADTSTDLDYVVAGYIAERVIRQSYEWLMERYVFNPTKMTTAMIAPLGSDGQVGSPRSVLPHILGDFGFTPYITPMTKLDYLMAPAGAGVSCSISDLLSYVTFHMNGLKGKAKGLTAVSYKYLHTPTPGEHNALGWMIEPAFGGGVCHRWAATDGAFYSEMAIWPDTGLATVAITNAGTLRQPAPTLVGMLAVKAKLEKKD